MRALILLLASGCYLGYFPVASGTVGSIAGLPLAVAFDRLRQLSAPAYVLSYAALVLLACWLSGKAEELLHEHDSHKIVIDEIAGYLGAMLFLPPTWPTLLLAFVVFRVLDVVKPFPAGYVDAHVPGGYGVVLDDVVSGLYTNVLLRGLIAVGWLA